MPLQHFSPRTLRVLLAAVLLFCFCRVLYTSRHVRPNDQSDFFVYKTASSLIWHGQSSHIYDGADTGVDPQLKLMPTSTTFSRMAVSDGISKVMMYVYPPILSDMLLPFAPIRASRAAELWFCCNLLMLGVIAWLGIRMLNVRWKSRAGLALTIGLCGLFSVAVALEAGQITILLLLLWMLSLNWYGQRRPVLSAGALALATAIKLTPLIAVVPFLLWRRWRWLGAFAATGFLLLGLMVALNSPRTVADYVFHVMPAMTRGVPHPENRSFSSALQMIYLTHHGETMDQFRSANAGPAPRAVQVAGKLLPVLCLLAAAAWVYLRLRNADRHQQIQVLASFAVLSVVVSPVSWVHAYVVAFPLLFLLWQAAFAQRTSRVQTVLLLLVSLDLGGFLLNDIGRIALRFSDQAAADVLLLGPLSALVAVFVGLQVASKVPAFSPSTALQQPA